MGDQGAPWIVHSERVVDDSRRAVWSIVDVERSDGSRFEQYVYRAPEAAMALLVNDRDELLMIFRYRFVPGRWVWELPGGWVNDGETPLECARREAAEEAGFRPVTLTPLLAFQPMVATADALNHVFVSYDAVPAGEPIDVNEAARVEWLPIPSLRERIASGEIIGSASVIGVQALLLDRR